MLLWTSRFAIVFVEKGTISPADVVGSQMLLWYNGDSNVQLAAGGTPLRRGHVSLDAHIFPVEARR